MDDFRLWVAIAAFGLGIWNLFRLLDIDKKNEYKDKRILYQDCLSEAKLLLEKMIIEYESLMVRRTYFDLLESRYIGSHGFQQAYSVFTGHRREIEAQKSDVLEIYENFDNVLSISEKEAFDACMNYKKTIKSLSISYFNSYAGALAQVEGIERMAEAQRENA